MVFPYKMPRNFTRITPLGSIIGVCVILVFVKIFNKSIYESHDVTGQEMTFDEITIAELKETKQNNHFFQPHSKTVHPHFNPINMSEQEYYNNRRIINEFHFQYSMLPNNGCKRDTFAVLFIPSTAEAVGKRAAVRNTWGAIVTKNSWPTRENLTIPKTSLIFVLGLKSGTYKTPALLKEQDSYGDLLQLDFLDSYNNLTLKSLANLKYASDFCSGASYLLKVDDDTIVNLPLFFETHLKRAERNIVYGHLHDNLDLREVHRNWKASTSERIFPYKYYPPYMIGPAYVISMDLVPVLLAKSAFAPWFTACEDVYVTGVLRKMIGGSRAVHLHMGEIRSVCDLIQDRVYFATNFKKPVDLAKFWHNLTTVDAQTC